MNEQVMALIAQQESNGQLPSGAGIAVSVVQDGQAIFNGTYGLRDRELNLPVTPETLFEISSLTKAFTSTALLMSPEVDLNKPLNTPGKALLPLSDPEISQKISILDILLHRTGLLSNDILWYFGSLQPHELLRAVANLDFLPNAFGQAFNYNNTLYGALGHLFKEVVGENWESSITRKILTPLKMTATSRDIMKKEKNGEKDVAIPYIGTQQARRVDVSAIAAAGAIRSNLRDMSKWMAFHLNRGRNEEGQQLLSESLIHLMQSKQIAVENVNPLIFQGLEWLGEKRDYGLGWFLGSVRGMKAVYHPGLIDGFSTALVMIPEQKLGFTVMTNVNLSSIPGLLIQKLLDGLLSGSIQDNASNQLENRRTSDFYIEGQYEHSAYGIVSITLVKGQPILIYRDFEWPLTWPASGKDSSTPVFVLPFFGLQIPMSVQFEVENKKAKSLSIPFSLDPRTGPIVFTKLE